MKREIIGDSIECVKVLLCHGKSIYNSNSIFIPMAAVEKMGPSPLKQTIGALNPERKKSSTAGT